jgi:hypothetical protein
VELRIREKSDSDALEKYVDMKWNDSYFGIKGKQRNGTFLLLLQ